MQKTLTIETDIPINTRTKKRNDLHVGRVYKVSKGTIEFSPIREMPGDLENRRIFGTLILWIYRWIFIP